MVELYRWERARRWDFGLFDFPDEPERGFQSSNKMTGRRKRKKSRKKKLPKASSTTSSWRKVDVEHQGMHDRAEVEFVDEVTTEYVQRADVLITHTVVSDTLHAEPLNSVHSKEVAGYSDEMNKLIEEKVIMGGNSSSRTGRRQ